MRFATEMTVQEAAGRAFGMAIGNLFLGFFGMLWILLGILSKGPMNLRVVTISPDRMTAPVMALLICFILALVLVSVHIMRRTYALQRAYRQQAQQKKVGRWFGWINFVQWGMIFAAVYALGRLGLANWILPAIILIVGVHFFPLAWLFGNRSHYVTGSAMVIWAILYPVLFSAGKGDRIGAVGTGAILWISACYTGFRGLRLLRRIPGSQESAVANGARV